MSLEPQQILKLLGIDYLEKSNRLAFCCPFHNDTDPSAAAYLDTQLFHCFACAYTLDGIRFYAKHQGTSHATAEAELLSRSGSVPRATDRRGKHEAARRRPQGEAELARRKETGFSHEEHAKAGEALDRILHALENGRITPQQADTQLEEWRTGRLTETDGLEIDS
jgi:DNA primase